MSSGTASDGHQQGIVERVVGFVTGNSQKDTLTPKKIASTPIKSTSSGNAVDKIGKKKRPTLGMREVSRRLGLSLPLHVAGRACQNDMERLGTQVNMTGRNMAIHGRASAVTTVAAIEYIASEVFKSAISHARKRGATTVSLLDVQRGIIVNPRLARSLRYSRVAVSNSANPLGIVPGMMIGIKHKKKKRADADESSSSSSSSSSKKTQLKNKPIKKVGATLKKSKPAQVAAVEEDSSSTDESDNTRDDADVDF